MGAGAISDLFACFGDPFLPSGLPPPALIGGSVPSPIAINKVGHACLTYREGKQRLIYGKEEVGGVEGEEGRESVTYERRINKPTNKTSLHLALLQYQGLLWTMDIKR